MTSANWSGGVIATQDNSVIATKLDHPEINFLRPSQIDFFAP